MMKPLAISTGDPGGVGPEIAARAMASLPAEDTAFVFGDAGVMRARMEGLGLGARSVREGSEGTLRPGQIGLVHVVDWTPEMLGHAPTAAGGGAQLSALAGATQAVMAGKARALVTAPMSKAAVNLSGRAFRGHTEYLAERAGLADDEVTMMFLGPRLRVALVTTHLSIAEAPGAITVDRVARTIGHLGFALARLAPAGGARTPRVLVAGLNPHAGEGGLFGDEELSTVAPALRRMAMQPPFADGSVRLEGPFGAETAFRMAADSPCDGVVAMLHDQATVPSKLLDWGRAVNVTWGLPFVRTSVDHGVAYDAARDGVADADAMCAAVRMARELTGRRDTLPSL